MKRKFSRVFLLVAAMLLSLTVTAQAEYPVIEWIRQLGTASSEYSNGVSVDSSGNAYVTVKTKGSLDGNTSSGDYDIFLTKYDTNGVKKWTSQLGTDGRDLGEGVSVDGSGNVYVTGTTQGNLDGNSNAGYDDVFLTKYDTNGVKQWTRQLGTAHLDTGTGVSVDSSGNAYVTGDTIGSFDGYTCAGRTDVFLTKYDPTGNFLWIQQLGTTDYDWGMSVSVDGSSSIYVTGNTHGGIDGNTSAGSADIFLIKYNTDGTKLWSRQMGTNTHDAGCGVSVDNSGNAYVTGHTCGDLDGNTGAGGTDMFLSKYNADGVKQWTRQLGTTYDDAGLGVSVDSNGNAYVTGNTQGSIDGNTNAGNSDMFLTKYSTNGTELWTCQLGTAYNEIGYSVSVDVSGNAYVTGYTDGGLGGNINVGSSDVFLVKISTVPEPSNLAILAGIALMMILYRKRKPG